MGEGEAKNMEEKADERGTISEEGMKKCKRIDTRKTNLGRTGLEASHFESDCHVDGLPDVTLRA